MSKKLSKTPVNKTMVWGVYKIVANFPVRLGTVRGKTESGALMNAKIKFSEVSHVKFLKFV